MMTSALCAGRKRGRSSSTTACTWCASASGIDMGHVAHISNWFLLSDIARGAVSLDLNILATSVPCFPVSMHQLHSVSSCMASRALLCPPYASSIRVFKQERTIS